MSGEFREIYGVHFMHSALENVTDEGTHPVSRALFRLYVALADVERDCAYVEAHDSTSDRAVLGLVDNWDRIEAAFRDLHKLRNEYRDLIRGILREHERKTT